MLQTSKNLYLRVLQALALSLSLMLIYQAFFANKEPYQTNQIASQNSKTDKKLTIENNLESKVVILREFSEDSIQEGEVLSIGRNLFQNSENLKKVSSQETFSVTSPVTTKSNFDSAITLLNELIPSKIYLQNKPAKLLIKGSNFSESTKIFANGTLLEAKVVNFSEIEAILPSHLLSTMGTLNLFAKTQKANKENLSNLMSLTIVKPPIPTFTFIGTFSDSGGQNTQLLLKIGADDLTVRVGDLVKNRWKISNLLGELLTFEDRETGLSYQVRKGEKIISQPIEELNEKKIEPKETAIKTNIDETKLFERSNKPMTSKELWEKRTLMTKEKKKL